MSRTARSQEVGNNVLIVDDVLLLFGGVEDVELAVQVLVDLEDTSIVSTSVAVVDCRPNGHQILLGEPVLVALHYQLVSACDQVKPIQVVELSSNFTSKKPTSTAG